jgi:low temperature requirement protein LtrA
VFAITRVTSLMAHGLSWSSIGRGLLVLAALWWGWAAFAWLTNHVAGDDGRARLVVFVAMSAMVLVALAVPEAFDAHALLFALAYLVLRMAHLALYWVSSLEEPEVHVAVARLLPTATTGPLLLVAAAFTDGTLQIALWIAALAIDYGGPLVFGVAGYRVHPSHFAERFSLIVIIALGESIVAIGVGAEGIEKLSAGVVAAAVIGVIVSAVLWWAYFDVVAVVSERRFRSLTGDARIRLARDSYSYLHLPIVAGIILVALGMKKTIAHVDEPLEIVPAAALYGGIAMYYLGHVAFRLRNIGTWAPRRVVVAVLLLALIPLATEVDALLALAVAAAIPASLLVYEAVRFADARHRLHAGAG